jgi:hypothetical protein
MLTVGLNDDLIKQMIEDSDDCGILDEEVMKMMVTQCSNHDTGEDIIEYLLCAISVNRGCAWAKRFYIGTTRDRRQRHSVITQIIEYTDFPLPKIELWFANDTVYLPSEH